MSLHDFLYNIITIIIIIIIIVVITINNIITVLLLWNDGTLRCYSARTQHCKKKSQGHGRGWRTKVIQFRWNHHIWDIAMFKRTPFDMNTNNSIGHKLSWHFLFVIRSQYRWQQCFSHDLSNNCSRSAPCPKWRLHHYLQVYLNWSQEKKLTTEIYCYLLFIGEGKG